MKKNDFLIKNKQYIIACFTMVLFLGLIFYIYKHANQFLKVVNIAPRFIFSITVLHGIHYVFLGLTHKLPLDKHNIKLGFKEWFGLCLMSELFNSFLPAKGGSAIRMTYLKQKYNFSIHTFLTMSFSIIVTSFTILGIIGTIYCHFIFNQKEIIFSFLESIFISLSISGLILITMNESISKILKIRRQISSMFYFSDIKLILKCTFIYLFMFSLYPLRIYLCFKAIGEPIKLVDSFELGFVILAVSIFELLPGNIGIKEIATAYVATRYGIKFENALVASLIDRAILFIFLVPMGSYFYWNLFEIEFFRSKIFKITKKIFAKG